MRAINHHDLWQVFLLQCLTSCLDALRIVVCALCTTTQNDEAVWVASSLRDSCETLLGHTHEVMLRSCSANGIHSDCQTTICAVLEAHWEGQTGCQLSVKLALSRPRTNGSHRNQIREELRTDGIQHLASNRHALRSQVQKQLPAHSQPLVDLVAFVDVRIVDQALPANSRAWLLEVGAHNDAEVIFELVGQFDKAGAVLDGCLGVVEGAWSDHDAETVIALLDDLDGFGAAFADCLEGLFGCWELGEEELWWDQRVVAKDWWEWC